MKTSETPWMLHGRPKPVGPTPSRCMAGRAAPAIATPPTGWPRRAQAVPVVGNGDILFPEDIARGRALSGVQAVMIARGALIKPWIFAEALGQVVDDSPEGRLAIYREYVRLAKEHFGDDERGHTRLRPFLVWHLGLWCRHIPRQADGSYVPMQERAVFAALSTPLEGLLAAPNPRCTAGSPTASWPATS